ncbi:MAG TPA: DNA-directed RNA polymerase subunit omega [Clostridiaceae bacterium]|nr:DNA-directed RNA polymerase subunit omega [Clostridiaceae bacterium]HBF78001.1 DNA-directed RNA polymerase subunit omega [Clostridiaceae bacterium]HBG37957.1 DNA-directed RNA polymerase subunit omega [Clostridiaceae bacterium]HBN27455.1 DNA-directed RNA polymerase subunit omega [Clostridiaceae bacterium]HBX47839.1 DNA-directed RNA polymerase subunit omega [Clostridiaceae bacterium]
MNNSDSMINPPILDLLTKAENRYSLVVMVSRRARQLIDGATPLVDIDSTKPVTIAINEINQGKITYESVKSGTK